MSRRRMACSVLVCLIVSLFAVEPSRAIENVRVAYPSLSTSVFCLIIAQKEGYLKEEGIEAQLLSIRGEIAIRTTLAGEVDFFTNAGSALAAAVRGVPVKDRYGISGQARMGFDRPARYQVGGPIAR